MPKKIIIFIFLIIIFVGTFFVYKNKFGYCSKYTCSIEIKMSEEEYNEKLGLIREAKENIKKDPGSVNDYLSLGLYYKSIGELGKAKDVYLDGVKVNDEFYLYYLNLGNVLVDMGDYAGAREFYLKAIASKELEASNYLKLVDLLFYKIKAPDKEIRDVYLEGLTKTRNDLNLCMSYASYLENIKEYSAAYDTWRICLTKDPDNEAIKELIKELKSKL